MFVRSTAQLYLCNLRKVSANVPLNINFLSYYSTLPRILNSTNATCFHFNTFYPKTLTVDNISYNVTQIKYFGSKKVKPTKKPIVKVYRKAEPPKQVKKRQKVKKQVEEEVEDAEEAAEEMEEEVIKEKKKEKVPEFETAKPKDVIIHVIEAFTPDAKLRSLNFEDMSREIQRSFEELGIYRKKIFLQELFDRVTNEDQFQEAINTQRVYTKHHKYSNRDVSKKMLMAALRIGKPFLALDFLKRKEYFLSVPRALDYANFIEELIKLDKPQDVWNTIHYALNPIYPTYDILRRKVCNRRVFQKYIQYFSRKNAQYLVQTYQEMKHHDFSISKFIVNVLLYSLVRFSATDPSQSRNFLTVYDELQAAGFKYPQQLTKLREEMETMAKNTPPAPEVTKSKPPKRVKSSQEKKVDQKPTK